MEYGHAWMGMTAPLLVDGVIPRSLVKVGHSLNKLSPDVHMH